MKNKIFQLEAKSVPKISLSGMFNGDQVNPLHLITSQYKGALPSTKRYRDYFSRQDVVKFLVKNGATLVQSAEEVNLSHIDEDEDDLAIVLGDDLIVPHFETQAGLLYFYKDNYIHVIVRDDNSECQLNFFYPSTKPCVDLEFREFIVVDDEPNIYMINQEYGQFTFSKFQIDLPKPFELALNYGAKFPKVSKKLVKSLEENSSGLFMMHGRPGTGKTTYIRYLASVLNKDVIFFPTSFVREITNPAILNLLRSKQNCVLILEDAEKALTRREMSNEPALVSTLLNMTDGILGDILKMNVIVTYNCERDEIDEALLRKGRLKAEYSFGPLDKRTAKKLAKNLGVDVEITPETTLSDLYYAETDEDLMADSEDLPAAPRIGFM